MTDWAVAVVMKNDVSNRGFLINESSKRSRKEFCTSTLKRDILFSDGAFIKKLIPESVVLRSL